jgi:hypothetical protein
MTSNADVFERYPHLLHAQTDPAMVALVEQLDTLYRSPEPPAHLTLAAVLARREEEVKPEPSPARLWSFRPVFWLPRRASAVVLALALSIVLMAGSVYAFTTFISPRLGPPPNDPGVNAVFKQHLLEDVQAAPQTIDGFKMNVQAAYADANRVIVGYTMTRPSGHHYDDPLPSDALLTTPQGDQLHWESDAILADSAYTMTFTALTGISSTARHITFHLSIHQLDVNEQEGADSRHLTLQGSMSFTFTVPFHAGRIATPRQSVTANGVTLTLERVVVSLSETRLYVQGAGVTTVLYPTLTVSDWHGQAMVIEIGSVNAHEIFISYWASLLDKHGEWTLKLQLASLQAPPAPQGTGAPWTFHFVVP